MMKCGQPSCACHLIPQASRPLLRWTYKAKGKTVNVELTAETATLYRALRNSTQTEVFLMKMERLSRTGLAHLLRWQRCRQH